MIEVRKLEPSEWHLLPDVMLQPQQAICIAIFKDGRVIGRIFLVSVIHLEDIFIEDEDRNGLLMHRLVSEAENEARKLGLTQILAFAKDSHMADYISRLGYKVMDLSVWSKNLWS